MAAADVTTDTFVHIPDIEVVQLTVSDGETYTSKKFKVIKAATATGNADVDAHLNVVPGTGASSNVVTINYAGQTDKLITLALYGNLGN